MDVTAITSATSAGIIGPGGPPILAPPILAAAGHRGLGAAPEPPGTAVTRSRRPSRHPPHYLP